MPSGDVLVLIDDSGRVVEWGRPAEELFGWSAEEAVGRSVTTLMSEAAADGERQRERFSETAAVLVKPVLRGTSVMWQVLSAGDAMSGQDVVILRAMFTHSPVVLHVLDNQLRVVRMSTATGGLHDAPVGHLLGKHFTEACELEDPEEEAAVAQRVLESGEPVVNRLVRRIKAPGRPTRRIHSVSYFRLEDSHGDVAGLVASAVDVTERENAQNRLALLDTVRTRVGHRLNVGFVCQELVEAVVPAFAGIADVEVIEDVIRGNEPPPVPVHRDVPLRRTAFEGRIADHPVEAVHPLPTGTPFSDVLSDLRPRLVSIEEDSSWLAADPARAEVIKRSGSHSLIVAPLALRGHALGVVSFYRHQDPFEEEDVAVASAVCAHAALCIDNARQFMREWIIAQTVQRRFLPQQPATHTTIDVSQLHLPAPQGGGAWYDAIALPGARTALIVGDVAGQGIAAAITMGLLRTAIHTLAALDLQPDELLARLSDTAARLVAARAELPPMDPLSREPLTAGCVIAIYDPVELTCTIARAGLPEPVAVLPDDTSAGLPVPPGPPLAEPGNAPFPATTVSLPEGSTLMMGTAALADEVLAPSGPLRPLLDGAGTRPLPDLRDDIAHALADGNRTGETLMLLARTKALPKDRVLTLSLPADPEAAPIARAAARHQLDVWGVDEETAYTTELIVSELVGNAVRYGAPPLQLRLIFERMLTCEVSDNATSAPQVKHARTIDETGRGLFIIASLADQWGTRYQSQGKTVWAEQPTGVSTERRNGAGRPR
ncbi:SpoIIE family protein phosphatase (plasmid) [Streptomyces sp. NBC_00841]|uniref:SpoIIE family protein phosphatase n=1 Tax=Streptomyces sp. NBC_00841 TaxID=2975847 RepID=UPI002DD995F5|nr:SpoIIE family protein phosphatase [Streptomyces sp. NBC_00841]WSA05595.1 SpoIIE family protein phosphatase [Streptomyces sp. NBC_00841]